MRDRIERLLVLPFSFSCSSPSSLELGRQGRKEKWYRREMKRSNGSFGFVAFQKPKITGGLHRLIRRIKSFSHPLFRRDEIAEMKAGEMEIGYPTDVKHVTHIGLDGSVTTNQDLAWIQTEFFHVQH
ncbi:CRIB domain-containing protein RIC2-like [Neltuma alba]|uniref:CRIB domain-containing protein RIC2-like n=1 Tax=Neltuma alba TaxID=207710 RepID=UPI0010A335DC|nr:CRIB domain-containing protein RIC2-like [Prosopis alba]